MSLLKKIINYIIIMSRSRYSNFISQDEPENLSHEFEDVFNHMDENKRINDEINRRIDEEEKEKERLNFIKKQEKNDFFIKEHNLVKLKHDYYMCGYFYLDKKNNKMYHIFYDIRLATDKEYEHVMEYNSLEIN